MISWLEIQKLINHARRLMFGFKRTNIALPSTEEGLACDGSSVTA